MILENCLRILSKMLKLASFTRASFKKNEEQQFHCLRDSSGHAGYSLRPKMLGWYGLTKVQEGRCSKQRAFCSCGEGVQTTREPNGG